MTASCVPVLSSLHNLIPSLSIHTQHPPAVLFPPLVFYFFEMCSATTSQFYWLVEVIGNDYNHMDNLSDEGCDGSGSNGSEFD